MGKDDVVYLHSGIVFNHEKGYLAICVTWIVLEGIMLSETSQEKTNTACYYLIWHLKKPYTWTQTLK